MTSPSPDYEEMAALHALGLLDAEATRQLLDAAAHDPEVRKLLDALDETAAHLAGDVPEVSPPPGLRRDIMNALPAEGGKILPFSPWFPAALAACLAGLAIVQAIAIVQLRADREDLRDQIARANDQAAHLRDSNALINLRVTALDAKDPAYAGAKILVAWDRSQHHGTVAMANLPPAPAGHDYQLWVLDPNAPKPLSAGVLVASRAFDSPAVSMSNPGFAVSLEPTGGSPAPTGPILFAVAPAE
jgi:anti-sigma-K factor RskA